MAVDELFDFEEDYNKVIVEDIQNQKIFKHSVPQIVFIIPYRDREAHLNCFIQTTKYLLTEFDDNINYEFVVVEQNDKRTFNRGAMKNIGFKYIKNKYPENYKNITFVFNDVDTFPGIKGILPNYLLKNDELVKHFYGFRFALGGVFSIRGDIFEKVNGFPNYWGWGFEDNCIQKRLEKNNIKINREHFYEIGDNRWIIIFHGSNRKLDNTVVNKFREDNNFGIQNMSCNINKIHVIDIDNEMNAYKILIKHWDIPEKEDKIIFEDRINPTMVYQPKVSMGNILKFK